MKQHDCYKEGTQLEMFGGDGNHPPWPPNERTLDLATNDAMNYWYGMDRIQPKHAPWTYGSESLVIYPEGQVMIRSLVERAFWLRAGIALRDAFPDITNAELAEKWSLRRRYNSSGSTGYHTGRLYRPESDKPLFGLASDDDVCSVVYAYVGTIAPMQGEPLIKIGYYGQEDVDKYIKGKRILHDPKWILADTPGTILLEKAFLKKCEAHRAPVGREWFWPVPFMFDFIQAHYLNLRPDFQKARLVLTGWRCSCGYVNKRGIGHCGQCRSQKPMALINKRGAE